MHPSESLSSVLPTIEQVRAVVADVLPRLVAALLVLLAGWLVAWTVRAIARRILRRLRARLPEGAGRAAWRQVVDEQGAGEVVAKGVYWLVIFAAAMVATEALGLPVLTTWLGAVTSFVPKVILAAAVAFAGVVGGRVAGGAVRRASTRMLPRQAEQLGRLTQVVLVVVALLLAASQLGLDVSLLTTVFLIVLATTLGGAALAFGLGARSVMANILAMHYVERTYRIGQRVRIGDDEGPIVRTTTTAVVLQASDGEVSIPGRTFADARSVRLGREAPDAG